MRTFIEKIYFILRLLTGADSLEYLSVDGLVKAVRQNMKIKDASQAGHCTACLTGDYPGGIPDDLNW